MHLWHKWKSVSKDAVTVFGTMWGRETERECILEIQHCSVCGKERCWLHLMSGSKRAIDPGFAHALRDRQRR